MFTKEERMDLMNLMDGAAAELFEAELERVVKNIMDPNTGGEKREINLKFIVKPNERKDEVAIDVTCNSKVSAAKGFTTHASIGAIAGRGVAHEYSKQRPLFNDKVASLETKRTAGKEE